MNNGPESSRKGPHAGVILPTVILVLAAVFAYLAYRPPLRTARPQAPIHAPFSPRTVPDIGAVYARLWEDPLEAAYRHWKEEAERRTAGDTWLPELERDRFRKIVEDSFKIGNGKLLFVPVLLPGGPTAEDREKRIRIRYAVLAGLGTCGYRLDLGDRMSYMRVPVITRFGVLQGKNPHISGDTIRDPIIIPVKLYRPDPLNPMGENRDRRFGGVLVCWLDQNQLGDRPLAVILQTYDHLFPEAYRDPENPNVQVSIVGPTGSDALLGMLGEARTWDEPPFNFSHFPEKTTFPKGTTLFSPRATVWLDVIHPVSDSEKAPSAGDFENCNIEFVRTIGTDKQLVDALREELSRRGAWPKGKDSKNHVVLITEQDTAYGRALPVIFREPEGADVAKTHLHVYKYLCGVDGALPPTLSRLGDADGSLGLEGQAGDKARQAPRAITADEPPEGRAQLDYLRRLERELRDLDAKLRDDGHRIAAIGVVGTDFYDKLLILRALRKRFGRVWFFTTDLEAGFSHAEEYDHTRNLLVASHFGLTLNPDLQRHIPPFRSVYQTSTYFATLLALNDPETKEALESTDVRADDPWGPDRPKKPHLRPLVFEVGRNGPYQLTVTRKEHVNSQVHPASPREQWWLSLGRALCLIFGGLGIIMCIAYAHTPTRKATFAARDALWQSLMLPLAVVGLFHEMASLDWLSPWLRARDGARTQGTLAALQSARRWGRNAVLAACIGWGRIPRWLARPVTAGQWIGVIAAVATICLVAASSVDHSRDGGEPFEWFEGISVWPSTLLRFLIGILSLVFIVKGIGDLERDQEENGLEFLGIPKGRLAKLPAFGNRHSGRRKFPGWWRSLAIWDWPPKGSRFAPFVLYRQYFRRGRPSYRWLRTVGLSAAYLAFGLSLFLVTDWPNLPYRGGISLALGGIVLFLAVVFMVMLVFFVLDATLLCRRFIDKLARDTYGWPAEAMEKIRGERRSDDEESLRELLTVRLIAERTNAVGKLIHYPCIVVLLMILSRHPITDHWDWPWPLVLLVSLNLSGAILCAVILRITAGKARQTVLRRLNDRLSVLVGEEARQHEQSTETSSFRSEPQGASTTGPATTAGQPPPEARAPRKGPRLEQLRLIIREIKEEDRGAFSLFMNNPVLLALAWPFAGYGGVLLIERLLSLL